MAEISELNLYQKLALMIRDAKAIPKRGWNNFHKYHYATHADVMEQTAELCGRYGVVVIQRPLTDTLEVIQRPTKNEGATFVTRLHFKYTIVNADNPTETIESIQIGEGADTGDKGIYKASTGADKYFWFRLLQISTGDDPEDGGNGKPGQAAVDRKRAEQSADGFISEADKREVFKAAHKYGFSHARMIEYLTDQHSITSTDRLTKNVADDLVEFMRSIHEQEQAAK